MAQGKKAAAGGKSAAKKVASRVKSAVGAVKKKVAPKKPAAPAKAVAKGKPAPAKAAAPKPVAKKPAPKPAKKPPVKPSKAIAKPKAAAKVMAKVAAKPVKTAAKAVKKAVVKTSKVTKPVAKAAKTAAKVVRPAAKPAKAAPVAKAAEPKKPARALPKAVPSKPPEKVVAPTTPAVPAPIPIPAPKAPAPAAEEKGKRGRRPRPRVTSSGAPAASWLTTEKPRAASFIPAPPRAEAPSAIAAPPASSDRLLRDDDVIDLAVRTVPVRIDVEQGAGRFYVHASPQEVTLRVGEGIEWDFRYLGGADVMCDEIVVEFEKPSPFVQQSFRTRKPGGARPHRALSGPVAATAAGQRIQYTVRAQTGYKTDLASARVWMSVMA
ncbi:MAG TPA: hypothetical protein VGF48_12525 [Thermoanaerobaculia bacterium]|jgi:hypothetical protein